MPYIGPGLKLETFMHDWQEAVREHGLDDVPFGQSEGIALPCAVRQPAPGAPSLFISAGIHGDEPAGPLALLRFLKEGRLPAGIGAVLMPLLNPEGVAAKTREHPVYGDLNRDYHAFASPHTRAQRAFLKELGLSYRLAICLHEDWESPGYYLYEHIPGGHPSIGREILAAVEPVCGIDMAPIIEGVPADRGLINRDISKIDPEEIGGWPEALYLGEHYAGMVYTTEAPSARELEQRIAAHAAALEVCMQVFA